MSNYATQGQLAEYLALSVADLPSDVDRMLTRASEEINYITLGRIDTTDTTHTAAAQKAVCALCEFWIQNAADTASTVQSYTLGKLTVNHGGVVSTVPVDVRTQARVKQALLTAGLLYRGVAQANSSVAGESSF